MNRPTNHEKFALRHDEGTGSAPDTGTRRTPAARFPTAGVPLVEGCLNEGRSAR